MLKALLPLFVCSFARLLLCPFAPLPFCPFTPSLLHSFTPPLLHSFKLSSDLSLYISSLYTLDALDTLHTFVEDYLSVFALQTDAYIQLRFKEGGLVNSTFVDDFMRLTFLFSIQFIWDFRDSKSNESKVETNFMKICFYECVIG